MKRLARHHVLPEVVTATTKLEGARVAIRPR